MIRRVLVTSLCAGLVAGCVWSGDEQRVDGVVVAVDGGLEGIDDFSIVTAAGERLTFEPADGLARFDHGGPMSHLFEHLVSGSRIRVTYQERGGTLIALRVADVP